MPWTALSGKPVEGGKEFPSLSLKCHDFGHTESGECTHSKDGQILAMLCMTMMM